MNQVRAAIAVGLFVVAALVSVIVGVSYTNRGVGTGSDTYALRAEFDDVTGIATGTKVTVAGFPVGEVSGVQLIDNKVEVTLRLRKQVKLFGGVRDAETGQLRSAAVLTRLQASLLGDFYLELAPGALGEQLKDGEKIPLVITATALQQTLDKMDKAADIVPKIDQIASDVAKITGKAATVFGSDEGAARFTEIANNLVEASRDLAKTTDGLRMRLATGSLAPGGDLDKGLHDLARTANKLTRLADSAQSFVDRSSGKALASLDNVEDITASVRDMVGRNKGGVDSAVGTLTSTLRKLEDTLSRADRVLANLESVTKGVEEGKGNVGRLMKDETLIRNAEAVLKDTGGLVKRFIDLELGLDYKIAAHAFRADNPDRLGWQSHLSLQLSPRPDRFVRATITGNNLGLPRTFTRQTLTSGSEGNGVLTEKFVENDDSFLFGIQYGRRFGWLTLRGGLIESTAGGGLDLHLLRDRVTLSADMFRFNDDASLPRLRAAANVTFWRNLYVWVGGDELLYPKRRADLFYGLGLSFTDNDLLVLFASAPSLPAN
jgi:phospholipid/cholesterol/gamma-HCH transport system substrate-binding protein